MNKTIALKEYNKRGFIQLDMVEFDLIAGMKLYSPDKISEAFSSLTGRELGLKDVELLLLITELSAALTPPVQTLRTSPLNWPVDRPYQSTFGGGEVMCLKM